LLKACVSVAVLTLRQICRSGWQLGEHNSWHKYTNFELGVRVPLIIRAPMVARNPVGVVAHGLAELIDVYPTLAELAGTAPPQVRFRRLQSY
jgi:arylsulfatase A-like enzyme